MTSFSTKMSLLSLSVTSLFMLQVLVCSALALENNDTIMIDPKIEELLKTEEWVFVLVKVVDTSNITINSSRGDPLVQLSDRTDYLSNLTNGVMNDLSESDAQIEQVLSNGRGFSAYISAEGLATLEADSRIASVFYNTPMYGMSSSTTEEDILDIESNISNGSSAEITVNNSEIEAEVVDVAVEETEVVDIEENKSSKSFFGAIWGWVASWFK